MTDPVSKPVLVNTNQGPLDLASAALRLVLIILSTAPAAALFLRKGDLIGLYNYFQTQPGVALAGALSGLFALGYGLYKSFKRGAQVASVAADPGVPSSIADIK